MNWTSFPLIAIGSAFLGSLATLLARTLLKDLKSKDILAVNFFTMGIVLLLLSPSFYFFQPSPVATLLIVLISLIDTAANYFFFKTFEKTEASIASPLLSIAPAFTFFFGWIILGDAPHWQSIVLSFVMLVAIILFSFDFKNIHKFREATLWPALLSSVLFGVSAIPSKYLLSTLHVINAPTLYMFRAGFIALFAVLIFQFKVSEISIWQYRIIFFRGLIVIAQWILLYAALMMGSVGVTVTLGNITPIFVFLLGMIFLKEKPTIKKCLLAVLVLGLSLLIA